LPAEVYALDGDYMVAPGARLEIGPDGKLYETMGGISDIINNPVVMAASTVMSLAAAYHGYKRNQSVGWALAWGAAGAFTGPLALVIALAQGFGKKK
jgi:hypothetical protein